MNGLLAAARLNSAWGTTQSALTGRCGRCCSVEPTAITTGASAAAAAAISGQVIHSYSTVPAPSTGLIRSSLTAASTFSISQIDTVSVCNFLVASIDTTSRQPTHIRYVIDTGIYCGRNNRLLPSQLSANPTVLLEAPTCACTSAPTSTAASGAGRSSLPPRSTTSATRS